MPLPAWQLDLTDHADDGPFQVEVLGQTIRIVNADGADVIIVGKVWEVDRYELAVRIAELLTSGLFKITPEAL